MRQVVGIVLAGLTWLLLFTQAMAATLRTLVATVARVADGDSVVAVTENGDKPGPPDAEDARGSLDQLIGGKPVRGDFDGRDHCNRVLAIRWDGPVNVNLPVVAMGCAEVYRGAPCSCSARS
jgi:endonuclease YncB( thermonuclease family)